jgi:hypothetical protein
MNLVEATLLENIDKPASLFVFPTDVAASRWADHLLGLRHGGTVAMAKFIAWDTFKQNSISSKVQNRKSIPSVLRKIFISTLIQENADICAQTGSQNDTLHTAAGKPPIFSSLIRTDWAQQAGSFAGWLTEILPQLGAWFRQVTGLPIARIMENTALRTADNLSGDDGDLFSLAYHYTQFLEKYGLFEPAWETPPFADTGKECFVFFPESLSDYNEYRDLLAESKHVRTIQPGVEQQPCDTFFFTSARGEITGAALYILTLHNNQNIPWDSISVSIPDGENYGPYLIREFTNRNIPYIKQSGKPLASYPAGQFFTALADCVSSQFSFSSLTALLLNRHLPWKDSEDIQDIIEFGIKNNCISSWTEEDGGRETAVDVWEEAFAHPFGVIKTQTRRFFENMQRRINAIRRANSFSEIRRQYFAFRERFFDMENCLEESDLVLSRCISELMYLVEIEKSFPDLRVPDPYAFFTGYLSEVNYLAQQSGSGVAILPYRTAAPAPFDCHIVLGASQSNLQAIFSPLAFLPKSKREKMGIIDNDASLVFIRLQQFNSRLPAAFFCSEQTFTGYAIPHSALDMPLKPEYGFGPQFAADLYRMENEWYASLHFPSQKQGTLTVLPELHECQVRGFEEWRRRRKHAAVDDAALSAIHPLHELIRRRFCRNEQFKNKFSVSATSLAPYFQCPLKWVFARVLDLENVEVKTGLMADNIAGQVYHAVLNLFLDDLRETGEAIAAPKEAPVPVGGGNSPALTDSYRRLLAEKVEMVFASFPRLPKSEKPVMSMLTARLLRSEKPLFFSHLENFLAVFVSFFAGFRVIASETYYSLERDFYYLNGVVDCILEDTRDASSVHCPIVIVDFKTKNMPKLSDCTGGEGLADFQLPMYLRLSEDAIKKEAHTALFFSVIDAAPQVVFGVIQNVLHGGTVPRKKENCILRGTESFLDIMDEFDRKAEQFAREISEGTFPFFPSHSELCMECEYSRVCRRLYKIYQGRNNGN